MILKCKENKSWNGSSRRSLVSRNSYWIVRLLKYHGIIGRYSNWLYKRVMTKLDSKILICESKFFSDFTETFETKQSVS